MLFVHLKKGSANFVVDILFLLGSEWGLYWRAGSRGDKVLLTTWRTVAVIFKRGALQIFNFEK